MTLPDHLKSHVLSNQEYWTRQQQYLAILTGVEAAANAVTLGLFLAKNIFVVCRSCEWYTPVMTWQRLASWVLWDTVFLCSVVWAAKLREKSHQAWGSAARS